MLESNIKAKNFKTIGISGIVYQGELTRWKIQEINHELRQICQRNKWTYIDNDNIHDGCLNSDKRHLYQEGLSILQANFSNCISKNFISHVSMVKH